MNKINALKIPNRIKNEFKSKSPFKIPTEEIKLILEDLYVNRKLSQAKIAKLFGVQKDTINRWLKRCNIPLRDRYDSVSISLTKYKNNPFSNDLNEKAYLIGIRYGDFSTQLHGRKIRISVSSTHPAMLKLFKNLFNKYGKVNSYPKYDKIRNRHLMCVYCDLDQSFNFLVTKYNEIPKWILENDELFFSFLSGYFDAEGCIGIYKNDNGSHIQWIIKSCDKELLNDILMKLNQLGFNLRFSLAKKADYKIYNKDYWYLGTGIKSQVLKILKLMSLKHEEKILKYKLVNEFLCKKFISKLRIDELHKKIKNDIVKNMADTKIIYDNLH